MIIDEHHAHQDVAMMKGAVRVRVRVRQRMMMMLLMASVTVTVTVVERMVESAASATEAGTVIG